MVTLTGPHLTRVYIHRSVLFFLGLDVWILKVFAALPSDFMGLLQRAPRGPPATHHLPGAGAEETQEDSGRGCPGTGTCQGTAGARPLEKPSQHREQHALRDRRPRAGRGGGPRFPTSSGAGPHVAEARRPELSVSNGTGRQSGGSEHDTHEDPVRSQPSPLSDDAGILQAAGRRLHLSPRPDVGQKGRVSL